MAKKFVVEVNYDFDISIVGGFESRQEAEKFAEWAWGLVADIPFGCVSIKEEEEVLK
jgi:hypothetical protein